MKVAIIGGTGVFGSRIAEMLARDGHEVLVCGRRFDAASEVAQAIGATALALDRTKDLLVLWEQALDVVVDAAGPFQMYGKDPYQLPRQAIEHGVHYFDLSDDAAFSSGINELDQLAKENGVLFCRACRASRLFPPALSAHLQSSWTPSSASKRPYSQAIEHPEGNRWWIAFYCKQACRSGLGWRAGGLIGETGQSL